MSVEQLKEQLKKNLMPATFSYVCQFQNTTQIQLIPVFGYSPTIFSYYLICTQMTFVWNSTKVPESLSS